MRVGGEDSGGAMLCLHGVEAALSCFSVSESLGEPSR